MSLESREGSVVVGLVGDFGDELGVDDAAVLVEDDDGAGEKAGHGAIGDEDSVFLAEARVAEGGEGYDIVDALGGAEAGVGEGEVLGDGQDDGVLHAGGELVEAAHGSGAHAGVEAGEDVEHYSLATEVVEADGLERAVDEREVGSRGSDGGKGPAGVDLVSLKCYCCHDVFCFKKY